MTTAPVQAQAAPAKASTLTRPATQGRCSALQADWAAIEKQLASLEVDGLTDNSAPRATMRAIETGNELTKAQLTLVLMQSAGCALPVEAPSSTAYLSAALTCETDRLKSAASPPSCDRSAWSPGGK